MWKRVRGLATATALVRFKLKLLTRAARAAAAPSAGAAPAQRNCMDAQDQSVIEQMTALVPPMAPAAHAAPDGVPVGGLCPQAAAAPPPPQQQQQQQRQQQPGPSPQKREAWKDYSSVFTAAKAGMQGVDQDHVKKVSPGSRIRRPAAGSPTRAPAW